MSAKTTEKTSAKGGFKSERRRHDALTVIFSILSFIYLIPIFLVAMNSFKSNASINLETFAFPREGTFVALDNYIKGLTFGNYPFLKSAGYSLLITIVSAALILLCTSMAAWYIARVGSGFSKLVYYLCVFSMVVPFQMVMFTLARTADTLKLNTPYTIPIIYLGFGAGLAVFMFSGFIKSIPLEIEEAAAIDGCGPIRTYFGAAHAQAYHDLGRCAGDYVGVERLPAALPGAGPQAVYDHSHSHSVPAGQLRFGGPGRGDGADHAFHYSGHHFLPHLPEAHH
jgi:ABC-type maltose transport system permease subunit